MLHEHCDIEFHDQNYVKRRQILQCFRGSRASGKHQLLDADTQVLEGDAALRLGIDDLRKRCQELIVLYLLRSLFHQ